MDRLTTRGWTRRAMFGGVVAVATLVGFGAVAFACTQRVGTFTVCNPASSTYVASTCTKITGTTQSGNLGLRIDDGTSTTVGSTFSAAAINFKSKLYSLTFRKPGASTDCHRVNAGTQILTATDGTTKFMGPTFSKQFRLPYQGGVTGPARLCTQDVPDVVTGQVLSVTVI